MGAGLHKRGQLCGEACLILLAVAEVRRAGALESHDCLSGKPQGPGVQHFDRLSEQDGLPQLGDPVAG